MPLMLDLLRFWIFTEFLRLILMISFRHNAIFVHIPKCAGQSVEAAFLHDISPSLDWDRHRHLLACFEKPASWSAAFPGRLAHLTAEEYVGLSFVSQEVWDDCFKFTIVRDPVDRMLSAWKYLNIREDFDTFSKKLLPKAVADGQFFFRSQCDYLMLKGQDKVAVDLVLSIKKLRQDWSQVQQRCGLRSELGKRNATGQKDSPPVTAYAAAAIREIYSRDYELLGEYF